MLAVLHSVCAYECILVSNALARLRIVFKISSAGSMYFWHFVKKMMNYNSG